jgi:hypothetical protein
MAIYIGFAVFTMIPMWGSICPGHPRPPSPHTPSSLVRPRNGAGQCSMSAGLGGGGGYLESRLSSHVGVPAFELIQNHKPARGSLPFGGFWGVGVWLHTGMCEGKESLKVCPHQTSNSGVAEHAGEACTMRCRSLCNHCGDLHRRSTMSAPCFSSKILPTFGYELQTVSSCCGVSWCRSSVPPIWPGLIRYVSRPSHSSIPLVLCA